MKYFEFYNTTSPVILAQKGRKMPELNANDTNSVKRWQDWAVQNGYMTQEQVDTGYGIYGPRTKAAFAKAIQSNPQESSQKLPSFEQYMYNTGALGGQASGLSRIKRLGNAIDEVKTMLGSALGFSNEIGEGAKRQIVSHLSSKNRGDAKGTAYHYENDRRYGDAAAGVGTDLKDEGMSLSTIISRPGRYTIGQNNFTSVEGGDGTYYDKETGSYSIIDPTDYHTITVDGKNYDIKNMTQEEIKNLPGNVWSDIKGIFTGEHNPMTAFENIGSRLGWNGTRTGYISGNDIEAYRQEYEKFLNDPKMQEQYFKQVQKYNLNS